MKKSFYLNIESLPSLGNNTSTMSTLSKTQRLSNSNSKFNLFSEQQEIISSLDVNEVCFTDRSSSQLSPNVILSSNEPQREGGRTSAYDIIKLVNVADSTAIDNYPDAMKEKILKLEKLRLEEEHTFELKRKALEKHISELKELHGNYLKVIMRNQEDIYAYQQEIDLLKIDSSTLQEEHKTKASLIANAFNLNKVSNVRGGNIRAFEKNKGEAEKELMELRSKIQKQNMINDLVSNDMLKKINAAKTKNEKYRNMITDIEEELRTVEQECKNIKRTLNDYYHNLLEKGSDMRQDGITWILKSIWSLGFDIRLSKLPNFLDEGLIKYFFKRTKLEVCLDHLKKNCEEIRANLSNKTSSVSLDFSLSKISKLKAGPRSFRGSKLQLDVVKEAEEDARVVKDYTIFYHNKLLSYKNINEIAGENTVKGRRSGISFNIKKSHFVQEYLNKSTHLDNETKENYNILSALQVERDRVKKEISDLTDLELTRLSKEFLTKNYCRRFNCSQKQVLSSILGIGKAHEENSRLLREFKIFQQKKDQTSLYSIIKS